MPKAYRFVASCLLVVAGCASDPPSPPATPDPRPPPTAPAPTDSATPPPTAPAPSAASTPPAPTTRPPRQKTTSFQLERGTLKLSGAVRFDTQSDKLVPESDEALDVVVDYLEAKPDITTLRIEGHTDGDGRAADNQALSERRAMAVARWLVANGIKCERLLPVGFGQTKPIAPNDTPDNKAQNRRIAFVNAALRGRAIGGMPLEGGGKVAGDPCK